MLAPIRTAAASSLSADLTTCATTTSHQHARPSGARPRRRRLSAGAITPAFEESSVPSRGASSLVTSPAEPRRPSPCQSVTLTVVSCETHTFGHFSVVSLRGFMTPRAACSTRAARSACSSGVSEKLHPTPKSVKLPTSPVPEPRQLRAGDSALCSSHARCSSANSAAAPALRQTSGCIARAARRYSVRICSRPASSASPRICLIDCGTEAIAQCQRRTSTTPHRGPAKSTALRTRPTDRRQAGIRPSRLCRKGVSCSPSRERVRDREVTLRRCAQ